MKKGILTGQIVKIVFAVIAIVVGYLIVQSYVMKPFGGIYDLINLADRPTSLEYAVACSYYRCDRGLESDEVKSLSTEGFQEIYGFNCSEVPSYGIPAEDSCDLPDVIASSDELSYYSSVCPCRKAVFQDEHSGKRYDVCIGYCKIGRCVKEGEECVCKGPGNYVCGDERTPTIGLSLRITASNRVLSLNRLKRILGDNTWLMTKSLREKCGFVGLLPITSVTEKYKLVVVDDKLVWDYKKVDEDPCHGLSSVTLKDVKKAYVFTTQDFIPVAFLKKTVITLPDTCIVCNEKLEKVEHRPFAGDSFTIEAQFVPSLDTPSPCSGLTAKCIVANEQKSVEAGSATISNDGHLSLNCKIPEDFPAGEAKLFVWVDLNKDGKVQPQEKTKEEEITVVKKAMGSA